MHEHKDCTHILKFCKNCDVVYCERCKVEWGKNYESTPVIFETPLDGKFKPYSGDGNIVFCTHN